MVSASSNLKTMINGFLVYVKQRARKMKNKRTEDILSGQSVRQCDIQTFHSVDDESSRSAEVISQELSLALLRMVVTVRLRSRTTPWISPHTERHSTK